jgi:hypothetical protein
LTQLSTRLSCSPRGKSEAGIPILNTKAIGIQFTEMLVRNHISHSPIAYPRRIQFFSEDVTKKIFA